MEDDQSFFADRLVKRPVLRHRGDCAYLTVRSWRAATRSEDLAAFRREKQRKSPALIGWAAAEIARELAALLDPRPPWIVTSVAPGHSRERYSWAVLLAIAAAERLHLPFQELFQPRPDRGSSHPRRNQALPPLRWAQIPTGPVLIVDDIATSGWHLEEALRMVRERDHPAIGVAWICGTVREPALAAKRATPVSQRASYDRENAADADPMVGIGGSGGRI